MPPFFILTVPYICCMNPSSFEHYFTFTLAIDTERVTDTSPLWGKMNAQQMLEHVCLPFLMATGKLPVPITTPEEKIPVLKRVLMSDKPFPRLFHNPLLPVEPVPAAGAHLQESKKALMETVQFFLEYFKNHPEATSNHNIYGPLAYHEWLVMNFKHIQHHFAQFGVAVSLK